MIDHLRDLKPDPRNARKHTPRNVGTIVDSLHEVGAARSIVIDESGVILAGNATVEAAAEAGIERVRVVDADGEEIIAVRRSGLSDEQKRRLALADNRAAELAEWDAEALLAEMQAGVSLDGLFRDDELAELLGSLQTQQAQGDPDEVPETPVEPVTKRGDIITLGRHRLMCGDATEPTDMDRLMDGGKASLLLTDPPYAVDYVDKARDMNRRGYGHSRAKGRAAIQGDGIEAGQEEGLWRDVFSLAFTYLSESAAIYIWHAQGRAMLVLYNLLEALGVLHHQTIIWRKNNFVIGRSDYQWIHEPCFYGWIKGSRPPFYGPKNQTTVWEIARDTVTPDHPTQKPVAIFEPAINNHLKAGEVLLDPFLGSGTALIAAEQTGATCYGMEIDPHYCDVIIERYQRFTGQTVERVA